MTVETFNASGANNWVAPAGVTSVQVEIWGGGGGGGATVVPPSGAAAAAAAHTPAITPLSFPATPISTTSEPVVR